MAVTNSTPRLVAASILRGLEDTLVAQRICSTEYLGEITKKGDSVVFPSLAEPTVSDYSGTVNYEALSDSGETLLINQAKYAAFKVGDIEAAQAAVELKSSQAERAMYRLRREIDRYVLGLYTDAGETMTQTAITSQNVVSTLSLMAQKLEEKNVDTEGMWVVVPPFVKKFLRDAGVRMQINNGQSGEGGLFWTNDLGFDLYVSNNLAVDENSATQILAGSYSAIAYAGQITESEYIRLQGSFDSAFRALFLFGAKVVKPNELICLPATAGTDSGI